MKKIIIILITSIFLTGCDETLENIVSEATESSQMDSMFEIRLLQSHWL